MTPELTTPSPLTVAGLRDYLHGSFMRYYNTAYELRSAAVTRERSELLNQPGSLFAEPYIELMPSFVSATETTSELMTRLGVPEAAELARAGLLPYDRPYAHQAEALEHALTGRDVVIGSGTGSGKTEGFLLPVLARLVRESRSWNPTRPAVNPPWWSARGSYTPQRPRDDGRPAAVRALLLYPMNALVEDQLLRLRRAFDSAEAHAWLDTNRAGARFFFGRYTGRTPVPGTRQAASNDRIKYLAELMQGAERSHAQLLRKVAAGDVDPDQRYFLPSVAGAEMRSRWDMQHSPPDILVTNYSMLSIALSREDEQPLLDATRDWIAASADNVFTLVVDELHMYRGTAGTEVAYLLRRLFHRLGLDRYPERLSIVATSASIGDDPVGHEYLRGFFARPARTPFSFVSAAPELPPGADSLGSLGPALVAGTALASDVPMDGTLPRLFARALADENGPRAKSFADVATKLLPSFSRDEATAGLDRLVSLLGELDEPSARLRAHLFVKTLQGLWACTDPNCQAADELYRDDERGVGKLYDTARFTCECGARVLELLYCESCGEVMLGGYITRSGAREFLVSSLGNLDELPDGSITARTAANYRVYWPTSRPHALVSTWSRPGTPATPTDAAFRYDMKWQRATLAPGTGLLQVGQPAPTGFSFRIDAPRSPDSLRRMPGLPTRCPSCAADGERRWLGPPEDANRSRSPIRTQGIGFDRANQVLTGALRRQLGKRPASNLVVFSDSRQGAARVSANLELNHYQDVVRALLLEELGSRSDSSALVRAYLDGSDRGAEATSALTRFQMSFPNAAVAYMKKQTGLPLSESDQQAIADAEVSLSGIPTLDDLVTAVEPRLLGLGMNPAGPQPSLQADRDGRSWTSLFTWPSGDAAVQDRGGNLDQAQRELLADIRNALQVQVIRTVFAAGGRDVESLGIAHVRPTAPVSLPGYETDVAMQVVSSVMRIMGRRWRVPPAGDARDSWARQASEYADAVARVHPGPLDGAGILGRLESPLGVGPSSGYRILAAHIRVQQTDGQLWRCPICSTRHQHASAGVCVNCYGPLNREPESIVPVDDYYAWLAGEPAGITRMHCEELTGQTDPFASQRRQARFQDVFLDDGGQPRVDGVDVLSVTTTMEAGVDIGALRGVVMANMPPQRFNYQQRVGRAGRRTEHLAIALTVCRGARSHDEHYFAHPEQITGDPPPQPFLDMSAGRIARRAIIADVLTSAFEDVGNSCTGFDGGRSVHGQFGSVDQWRNDAVLRSRMEDYLRGKVESIRATVQSVLRETELIDVDEDGLVGWITSQLASEVDMTANTATVPDLAEALARAGLLPMFGFPTQVKVLFTAAPRRGVEPSTLDRDSGIAISEFAPGSEVVKDKAIHTAVGVVDPMQTASGGWIDRGDPLGTPVDAGLCRSCLGLTELPGDRCPTCGAEAPDFNRLQLVEPTAYRTSYSPRDYEQLGEPASRASQPRLVLPETAPHLVQNAELRATANAEIVAVNDNRGEGYAFSSATRTWAGAAKNVSGLIEDAFLSNGQAAQRARTTNLRRAGSPGSLVALAARRRTDVLVVGFREQPAGVEASPLTSTGRAAWASLGYALRDTAVKWLDIGPDELQVGVHPRVVGGRVHGEAFIGDTLENGAGYATRLAKTAEELFARADAYAQDLQQHGTSTCDSSCYACLRDYRNSHWHSLLDWRLAGDMLGLLLGRPLTPRNTEDRDRKVLAAFAKDFSLSPVDDHLPAVRTPRGRMLGLLHPLEDEVSASRAATFHARHPGAMVTSAFHLIRQPGVVAGRLLSG
jgi:hypothetical protein